MAKYNKNGVVMQLKKSTKGHHTGIFNFIFVVNSSALRISILSEGVKYFTNLSHKILFVSKCVLEWHQDDGNIKHENSFWRYDKCLWSEINQNVTWKISFHFHRKKNVRCENVHWIKINETASVQAEQQQRNYFYLSWMNEWGGRNKIRRLYEINVEIFLSWINNDTMEWKLLCELARLITFSNCGT
jgi:hypothetical protein